MGIVRSMIDHIEIHLGTERSNPDVILSGALAQILAFTQQKKPPPPMEATVGSWWLRG